MDLTNITTPQTKTPDTQTESPPQTHLTKSLSFTNKTFQLQLCHHHQNQPQPQPQPMVVSYKECLKNHAATMGGHALDGCGEFMPSPTATPLNPTSLKCAACGCHRNFHRRDLYEHQQPIYQLPPPPRTPSSGPSSAPSSPQQQASPSPAPYSYYTSAPHMLLALSNTYPQPFGDNNPMVVKRDNPTVKKRSRTKFSQEQKEKMSSFAEKLGWRLQRSDDNLVQQFCNEVGVERGVFKVWMHNNKQTLGKRGMGFCLDDNKKSNGTVGNVNGSRVSFDTSDYKTNINGNNEGGTGDHVSANVNVDVTTNGSYSSSLAE